MSFQPPASTVFPRAVKSAPAQEKIAVLSSLHDLNQALAFGDRFFFLKDGVICYAVARDAVTEDMLCDVFGAALRLREVDGNIIEAAQSMGATPMQIICKVMIPESVPSLLQNVTIALTTILGYSAMSGIIGGGGLGKIAIDYGYYRYKYLVMLVAVIILVLLVQVFQSLGTWLGKKCDKRLKR